MHMYVYVWAKSMNSWLKHLRGEHQWAELNIENIKKLGDIIKEAKIENKLSKVFTKKFKKKN